MQAKTNEKMRGQENGGTATLDRKNQGATVETWRWGILAATALALVTLWPTLTLWFERGVNYNGFYGLQQYDEEFYAGYINTLLLGRPRQSDPAQCGGTSNYESLFSIQFVPAYLIAIPTRFLGISVSTVFIVLMPLIAFLAILSVYVLIRCLTGDTRISAIGALCVLCLGTVPSGEGLMGDLVGSRANFHGLLFLRRYLPGVPFPLFFAFCAFTWRAFTDKSPLKYSLASGLLLLLLIFSYFYLWTFALAWTASFALLSWIARTEFRSRITYRVLPIAFFGGLGILLYAKMLSRRAVSSDPIVALESSHALDVFRYSEIACLIIAAVLYYFVRRQQKPLGKPSTVFTFSLLLTPLLVFNQQVLTGLSLQPYHYEFYIGNYVTVLAAVLTAWILWEQRIRKAPLALIGCIALFWAWGEMAVGAKLQRPYNIRRDALLSISERIKGDGVVYSDDVWVVNNHISTFTSLPVLWGLHTQLCSSLTPEEARERFYQYLYYTDYRPEQLRRALQNANYIATAALFGYERAGEKLLKNRKPVSADEIEQVVGNYSEYISRFSLKEALHPQLSYVIITEAGPTAPTNLDLWYERDEGERIGEFVLYRVSPRQR